MADLNTRVSDLDADDTITVMNNSATITTTSPAHEQFCAECNGMAEMHYARATVDSVDMSIDLYECPHCQGLGYVVHAVTTDHITGGVTRLPWDEEDERLLELRENDTPVWVRDRDICPECGVDRSPDTVEHLGRDDGGPQDTPVDGFECTECGHTWGDIAL